LLIRITPERYISLERVQDIEFFTTRDVDGANVVGFVVTLEDGSRISHAGDGITERMKFFLEEVFIGNVIDLEKVYEKKDEILAVKQVMKDKIEEIKAQKEGAPKPLIFEPQSKIVREPGGLKNVFVLQPKKPGGTNNGGNAA
jgi:hypothetical protein